MRTKIFAILAAVAFFYIFSLSYADAKERHPSLTKIYQSFTNYLPSEFSITEKMAPFKMGGKDFLAIYFSAKNVEDAEQQTPLNYNAYGTMTAICDFKPSDGSVSDCRKVDLGGLQGAPDFVFKDDFITLELSAPKNEEADEEDNKYYLAFKYINGDFYLHQFSYTFPAVEPIENGAIQTKIYYRTSPGKGYNLKMRNIGFENLYPERYENQKVVKFIKDYPYLKKEIDNIAGFFEGDSINLTSEAFKIKDKEFLAVMITSALATYQIPSTTGSWCLPLKTVIMVCGKSSGGAEYLCENNFNKINNSGCVGNIVYKDDFITFENTYEDRIGYIENLYYTFKYTKGEFYLHQYSSETENINEEDSKETAILYRRDDKKGYEIRMIDADFQLMINDYFGDGDI